MAIGQLTTQKLHFCTAHFHLKTAQIVINCTLKYAMGHINLQAIYQAIYCDIGYQRGVVTTPLDLVLGSRYCIV